MLWGALLVATNIPNTCIYVLSKLDKNWLRIEQNTTCPYLAIHTKYDRFWPINWANINIFERNQLYNMEGKHQLLILYEYQLNTYLTVDSVVKLLQKLTKIANISVLDIQTIEFVQNIRTQ